MCNRSIFLSLSFLVLLVQSKVTINSSEGKCHNPDQDFYPFLGTRTAYTFVRGFIGRPRATCEPKQVWMLGRHGTRYPGEKSIKQLLLLTEIRNKIIENHNNNHGRLCVADLKNLEKWKLAPEVTLQNAEMLTIQGKKDLFLLAKRMKSALPELLKVRDPQIINNDDFLFRSTDTDRTKASLRAFAEGLFGGSVVIKPEKIPQNDTLLLLHKNCPAWEQSYEKENVTKEREEFRSGHEVRKLVDDISARLGFTEKLKFDQIKTMYEMCRLETAWYLERDSPWCTVFHKRQLKIFEYLEDLDYYYCCGSGRKMSQDIGCQALTHMFDHFKKIESGKSENQPKGIFLFAHSITIQTFLSTLSIGKDTIPFSAKNFAESDNRKYRTSLMGPFATNFVAIFYRCKDGPGSPNKVMFYLGESLISVSSTACENGICEWEAIKKEFGSFVRNCNTDFCNNYTEPPNQNGANMAIQYSIASLLLGLLFTM